MRRMLLPVVVWLTADDGEGAVQLFEEDESNHLVREGHGAEAQETVGAVTNLWAESVGTADDKDQRAAE